MRSLRSLKDQVILSIARKLWIISSFKQFLELSVCLHHRSSCPQRNKSLKVYLDVAWKSSTKRWMSWLTCHSTFKWTALVKTCVGNLFTALVAAAITRRTVASRNSHNFIFFYECIIESHQVILYILRFTGIRNKH